MYGNEPNRPLCCHPVICCAASKPHIAAVGQEVFDRSPVEEVQQVLRKVDLLQFPEKVSAGLFPSVERCVLTR